MIIEQIYIDNPLRNFNYLIACKETGEALVIDPLDAEQCLKVAQEKGWQITKILNTHEHWDHIDGNATVQKATGAKIYAHQNAKDKIPNLAYGLDAGDSLTVGKSVAFEVLDTPGHTHAHVCLLAHGDKRALFCGDTLFNAGVGHCHNGNAVILYETFAKQLAQLPDDTLIYPGHDYIHNNLRYTLDREPNNQTATHLLSQLKSQDPHHPLITSLALEKQINTFLRLQHPEIIEGLREKYPSLPKNPSPEAVFVALRQLRNSW